MAITSVVLRCLPNHRARSGPTSCQVEEEEGEGNASVMLVHMFFPMCLLRWKRVELLARKGLRGKTGFKVSVLQKELYLCVELQGELLVPFQHVRSLPMQMLFSLFSKLKPNLSVPSRQAPFIHSLCICSYRNSNDSLVC